MHELEKMPDMEDRMKRMKGFGPPDVVGTMCYEEVDISSHGLPEGLGPVVEELGGIPLVLLDVLPLGGVDGLEELPLHIEQIFRNPKDFRGNL